MIRRLAQTALAAAVYGFAVGSGHSLRLATWNLAKFPMLIALTCGVCGPAYWICVRLIAPALRFGEVMDLTVRTFRDLTVLLAALSPVCLFLARTYERPDRAGLGEYPFFLGLNVCFIAVCGALTLGRQTIRLVRRHGLRPKRSAGVLAAWLAISLFAGGQCAWVLRPFYAPATIEHIPFIEGSRPDYRGAANFYEAVYHLLAPPRLPRDYWRHNAPPPPPEAPPRPCQ